MQTEGTGADRFAASAAHGQARAVVDGTGRLIELGLDTGLLRRPAWAVADAVIAAVNAAQDSAFAAQSAAQRPDAEADIQRFEADLAAIDEEAQRRLAELRVIVSDLVHRRER